MLVGHVDAADHVVALPDHPHLFWSLDEVHGLSRVEQLPGHPARVTARLRCESDRPLATDDLFVRLAHLLRGPGLEHRVLVVAEAHRHLPAIGPDIADIGMVGVLSDGAAAGARWRVEPIRTGQPGKVLRRKIGDMICCRGLRGKRGGPHAETDSEPECGQAISAPEVRRRFHDAYSLFLWNAADLKRKRRVGNRAFSLYAHPTTRPYGRRTPATDDKSRCGSPQL